MFLKLVFPFGSTFRRLHLHKYWWHRLAIVSFWATLLLIGGSVWFGLNRLELGQQEEYRAMVQSDADYRQSVAVTTDEKDKIRKELEQQLSQGYQQYPVYPWANLGIGIVMALIVSYLLQLGYRLLLYIVFGSVQIQGPNMTV